MAGPAAGNGRPGAGLGGGGVRAPRPRRAARPVGNGTPTSSWCWGPRREAFAAEHVVDPGDEAAVVTRPDAAGGGAALLMYASCAWFFNDLAGIETVQSMRCTASCYDLLAELGEPRPVDAVLATAGREPAATTPPRATAARSGGATSTPAGGPGPGRRPPGADRPAGRRRGRRAHRRLRAGAGAARDRRPGRRGGVCRPGGRDPAGRTRRRTRWTYAALHLGGLEVFGAVRPAAEGDRDAATWPPWWATPPGGPGHGPPADGRRPLRAQGVRPGERTARGGETCCGPRPRAWPTGSWPPTTSCARTTTTPWPPWPWRARRWRPSCGARSSWRWPAAWRGRWPRR